MIMPPKPVRLRSPVHLRRLMTLRCTIPGCSGWPVDPHHLKCGPEGGGSVRASSNDPRSRLATFRTASGFKMTLVKVYPERGHEERTIHRRLARHRLGGEWFRDTNEFRSDLSEALGTKVTFRPPVSTVDDERYNLQDERDAMERAVAICCEEIVREAAKKAARRQARHV
jgi:hypothetical protein